MGLYASEHRPGKDGWRHEKGIKLWCYGVIFERSLRAAIKAAGGRKYLSYHDPYIDVRDPLFRVYSWVRDCDRMDRWAMAIHPGFFLWLKGWGTECWYITPSNVSVMTQWMNTVKYRELRIYAEEDETNEFFRMRSLFRVAAYHGLAVTID